MPARAWGGLPAALLAAGARRVIWTATDVDDRAASEWTVRLHGALAQGARGDGVARDAAPELAYGRALAEAGADRRTAACLLPFRISGVRP